MKERRGNKQMILRKFWNYIKEGTKTYLIKGTKKSSKVIKKLKAKKKYFVRIRSFTKVKVNGKTKKVFSAWSKVQKVKVRK